MLRLFHYSETEFGGNGKAVLENAKNVLISQELNGDYKLSFEIPLKDEKRQLIYIRDIVRADNQLFRIYQIDDSVDGFITNVYCRHIFFDSEKIHIPDTDTFEGNFDGDIVDTTAFHIMKEAFKDTNIHILTDSEASLRDLENEDKGIDFWRLSKTTPCGICEKLLSLLGRGQLYINNFDAGIVKKIGCQKEQGIILRKEKNILKPKRTIATDNLITRLYPYGADDLHIDGYYIDSSDGIMNYGVVEGYKDYNNIETPERLLEYAQWEFDEDNDYRIDKPSISYEFDFIELERLGYEETLKLGDIVKIVDNDMGVCEWLTVTYIEYYPYEANSGKVKIGNPVISLGQLLKENMTATKSYKSQLNKHDEIKVKNTTIITTIEEVTKETVLATEVLEASAVFCEDIFVEKLETNLKPYKCIPNLEIVDGETKWINEENHTYSSTAGDSLRGAVEIEGISLKFKECHLSEPEDLSNLTIASLQPLKINGRQVYYTSVLGGANPYEYFTFTDPKSKYPEMTDDNASMFTVYIRKYDGEYTKAEFEFVKIDGDTYKVRFILGAGDESGNGKIIFEKDGDFGYFKMTSRTDGLERGIRVGDDRVEYCSDGSSWLEVGSGGGGSGIITQSYLPTESDILGYASGSVIAVYDVSEPYIPEEG